MNKQYKKISDAIELNNIDFQIKQKRMEIQYLNSQLRELKKKREKYVKKV